MSNHSERLVLLILLLFFKNIVQGKRASISRMQWHTAIDKLSDDVKM